MFEPLDRVWKHSATGWTLFIFSAFWCLLWWIHVPTIGYAIGALAVVAAVMAARMEDLNGLARFLWIFLLFSFLYVETKAIDEEKRKSTKELTDHFQTISTQAQTNLRQVLDDETKNFKDILDNQQKNFTASIRQQIHAEREQNREFKSVLAKEQQLFEHQQQLAQFLTGKILPASDPTPAHNCGQLQSDDVILFLGSNAMVANRFPHTILQVLGQSVVSIDRTESGSLVLSVDMRDTSNRIIARLDKNGFVVNNAYTLFMLRPDNSTVIIEDQFGKEVLNARFLNPGAFKLTGVLQYRERLVRLELPNFQYSCFIHNGIDIAID